MDLEKDRVMVGQRIRLLAPVKGMQEGTTARVIARERDGSFQIEWDFPELNPLVSWFTAADLMRLFAVEEPDLG